jgi:cytochrome c553
MYQSNQARIKKEISSPSTAAEAALCIGCHGSSAAGGGGP